MSQYVGQDEYGVKPMPGEEGLKLFSEKLGRRLHKGLYGDDKLIGSDIADILEMSERGEPRASHWLGVLASNEVILFPNNEDDSGQDLNISEAVINYDSPLVRPEKIIK